MPILIPFLIFVFIVGAISVAVQYWWQLSILLALVLLLRIVWFRTRRW